MKDSERSRLDFGHFIDRAFWALMSAAILYSASQLREMGKNIAELNEKVAVIIVQVASSEKRSDLLEKRIERLEYKRK